ncbi:PIG-L deacetylase family protein [Streptomyces albospinus]|uniref:PIG-L deacetylase family protein n=1 Tax=Streptomyces albospinus TaxID=285515 RepID=UPI001E3AE736|nr:PIG-L deacetylase family protein [Streptomyces albospinus]
MKTPKAAAGHLRAIVRSLHLKYWPDLSESEIGATTGISPGAVKPHPARGSAGTHVLYDDNRTGTGIAFPPASSRAVLTGHLPHNGPMATVLAFHAHPDDEVLMTGGTLARAAAEGHRVVIAVATDHMDAGAHTESPRLAELRASAAVLGVHRVVHLGYAASGHGPVLYPDPPGRTRFARADTQEAAERLAALLREEDADLLLSYDANGGYGHRDHVKVHQVGRRAAELAGTPRLLEATMPRETIARAMRLVRALRIPFRYDPDALRTAYSPRSAITHTLGVRRFARQKQAALAAHRSQVAGTGRLAPVMRTLVRLPAPLFGLLLGREWFAEVPVRPAHRPHPAGLRSE